jgi:hypothetical protein
MKAENRIEAGCFCEGRLETESSRGARSGGSLERAEEDGAVSLLAKVLERENLNSAYKRVKKNGGGPGIDGIVSGPLCWVRIAQTSTPAKNKLATLDLHCAKSFQDCNHIEVFIDELNVFDP